MEMDLSLLVGCCSSDEIFYHFSGFYNVLLCCDWQLGSTGKNLFQLEPIHVPVQDGGTRIMNSFTFE